MIPHTFDQKNKTNVKYRVFTGFFKENFSDRMIWNLRIRD